MGRKFELIPKALNIGLDRIGMFEMAKNASKDEKYVSRTSQMQHERGAVLLTIQSFSAMLTQRERATITYKTGPYSSTS